MSSTRPIRVGLVGLTSKTRAFAWANKVHFPYFESHPSKYTIVAILGSTRIAAEEAIAKFGLPASTRAYGSAQELADDEEVDLVSIVTKCCTHRDIIVPSIEKGKDVFVEWPVDINVEGTKELASLAETKGVKTMIGLQGRYCRIFLRVQELVSSGKIGKVLSTTVVGTVPTGGGGPQKESVKYALAEDSGATMVDIHFAQFIEGFSQVLGTIKSLSATISTQRHSATIIDDSTGAVIDTDYPKTAPDQVLMNATLVSGAVASFHMHGGTSIGGGCRWLIYGTDGEIEVRGPTLLLHLNTGMPWKVKVHVSGTGTDEEEDVVESEQGQLAVGKIYEAFLEGKEWPDLAHAVRVHGIVEAMWESSRTGKMVEV